MINIILFHWIIDDLLENQSNLIGSKVLGG